MATSIDPNGNTNGVSGKLIYGAPAGGLAAGVGSTLVYELSKIHAVAQVFADAPWLPGILVAVFAALATFGVGYIAKHAPAGLVEDFRDVYATTSANPANLAPGAVPANQGSNNGEPPK